MESNQVEWELEEDLKGIEVKLEGLELEDKITLK
jgi:hypothetical protein